MIEKLHGYGYKQAPQPSGSDALYDGAFDGRVRQVGATYAPPIPRDAQEKPDSVYVPPRGLRPVDRKVFAERKYSKFYALRREYYLKQYSTWQRTAGLERGIQSAIGYDWDSLLLENGQTGEINRYDYCSMANMEEAKRLYGMFRGRISDARRVKNKYHGFAASEIQEYGDKLYAAFCDYEKGVAAGCGDVIAPDILLDLVQIMGHLENNLRILGC